MKVLHSGDWHLGIDLHKVSLLKDQRYFLSQLRDIVITENVDVVLISGDIYDTSLASKEAIELFNDAMHMLCMELHKQVIVIAGNHDSPTRLSTCASLLAPMGLHIIGKVEHVIKPIQIKDTFFYPFPFFHVETINRVYGVHMKNEEEAFQYMIEQLDDDLKKPGCHIALAHAFLRNMETCDSERYIEAGGAQVIQASIFEKFDYVALGHLHRMQKALPHVVYSGSPLPYSFSEAQQEKYVLIFDTDTKQIDKKVIQPLHPLKLYKGNYDQIKQELLTNPCLDNTYVKVEIEDQMVSHEMFMSLQEYVPSLLQVSGKTFENQSKISLEIEQLQKLSDEEILKFFFEDIYQEEIDAEQLQFYFEALQGVKEG